MNTLLGFFAILFLFFSIGALLIGLSAFLSIVYSWFEHNLIVYKGVKVWYYEYWWKKETVFYSETFNFNHIRHQVENMPYVTDCSTYTRYKPYRMEIERFFCVSKRKEILIKIQYLIIEELDKNEN